MHANRRRRRGDRGQTLRLQRSEYAGRPFARLFGPRSMRRVHRRGHLNTLERLVIRAGSYDLTHATRKLVDAGTPGLVVTKLTEPQPRQRILPSAATATAAWSGWRP